MSSSRSQPPVLRVLSQRTFALFEGGLFPQYMTSWVQRVGVAWLAWQLTESPTWLGIIATADLAPMLVLAPFAGAVADRMEPLRLIKLAQIALMVQAFVMAALTAAGLMRIEWLFLLSIFNGCVFPFHSAARQSIIPTTVTREDFSTAVAIDSACFHSNRFIGPALAAFIIPWFGVLGAFVTHIVGSLISVFAFSVVKLAPPDRSRRSRRNLFLDVAETFSYAWYHKALRPLLLILFFASVLVRPMQDMLAGFADVVFGGNAATLAWLTSGMGVGALLGAVHVAVRGGSHGLTHLAIFGYLCTALGALGFVATKSVWVGVAFAFIVGYGLNVMSTCIQSLMQLAVDDHVRGRVLSLYLLIYRGTPAAGALVIGIASESLGLQMGLGIPAALCVVVLLSVLPARRQIIDMLEVPPPVQGKAAQ